MIPNERSVALSICDLRKSFGPLQVLDGCSFSVFTNSILVILGPSGCGKTTLLRILSGELEADSGSLWFGVDRRIPGAVAVVPQRDLLFPWCSLRRNALVGAQLAGRSLQYGQVDKLLDNFGLHAFAQTYPAFVSGGMRQRVAFVRAVGADPHLLLLDEGFAQVDFHQKVELEGFVRNWVKAAQKAVVAVSHDVESALALADRIIVLSRRPAKVELDLLIELQGERTNTLAIRGDSRFIAYLAELRAALKTASGRDTDEST